MFHLEMRQGIQSVRAFNLTEPVLSSRFMAPLMADADFTYEGHDWTPRKTRLRIFEGPELQTYELGMGRGWQAVERKYTDVTELVLEAARRQPAPPQPAAAPSVPLAFPVQPAVPTQSPATVDSLRERLIGRLFAEPVSFEDVVAMAAELMPGTTVEARLAAAEIATIEVLQAGSAHLSR